MTLRHAWLHVDADRVLLLLDRASIKAEDLSLVGDLLARAIVDLFKSHIDSDFDVLGRRRSWLIETTVGRAEVTAFNLKIGA